MLGESSLFKLTIFFLSENISYIEKYLQKFSLKDIQELMLGNILTIINEIAKINNIKMTIPNIWLQGCLLKATKLSTMRAWELILMIVIVEIAVLSVQ